MIIQVESIRAGSIFLRNFFFVSDGHMYILAKLELVQCSVKVEYIYHRKYIL